MIFGVDNSGPHTGEECVCLMGVVFRVQSSTFYFPLATHQETGDRLHCLAATMLTRLPLTRFIIFTRESLFSCLQQHLAFQGALVLAQKSCDRQNYLFMGLQSTNGMTSRMTFTTSSKRVHSCAKNK